MKKLVGTVLFFAVVASCNVFAQRIKVIPQVGVGNYLDRDHAQGRGLIGIEGDVQLLSDKLEVGLLIAGGSDFIPTGDPEIRNDLDTVQINPRAHRFNLFSLVQRYHFLNFPAGSLYLQANQGVTKLRFLSLNLLNDERIEQSNFSFGFGAGVVLEKFDFRLQYYDNGLFNSYEGRSEDNQYAFMNESGTGIIMLQVGYVFGFF